MNIQDIERAVLRQLPFRKQHLPPSGQVTKDFSPENILIIICGLASVYIKEPKKACTEYYDMSEREHGRYVRDFFGHLLRVREVVRAYGINPRNKDFYKLFSEEFWKKHNKGSGGEIGKSGIILSHILSSKREFREFVREDDIFREGDFTSFFVYNKAQLSKNFLNLRSKERKYVDFFEMAY